MPAGSSAGGGARSSTASKSANASSRSSSAAQIRASRVRASEVSGRRLDRLQRMLLGGRQVAELQIDGSEGYEDRQRRPLRREPGERQRRLVVTTQRDALLYAVGDGGLGQHVLTAFSSGLSKRRGRLAKGALFSVRDQMLSVATSRAWASRAAVGRDGRHDRRRRLGVALRLVAAPAAAPGRLPARAAARTMPAAAAATASAIIAGCHSAGAASTGMWPPGHLLDRLAVERRSRAGVERRGRLTSNGAAG